MWRYMMLGVTLPGSLSRSVKVRVLSFLLYKYQPSMILHELCHGLHWRLEDTVDHVISEAFVSAKASGRYEAVPHYSQSVGPHYCLTDKQEYFSECSEAFWSSRSGYHQRN